MNINKGGTTVTRPCRLALARLTGTCFLVWLCCQVEMLKEEEMMLNEQLGDYPAKLTDV